MQKLIIPNHIGIILDGNGRWATRKGLPRYVGHRAGVEAVNNVIYSAKELGIKCLSMFAFSTENWKRDKSEIDHIFDYLREYLSKNSIRFKDNDIKIMTSGELDRFPADLQSAITNIVEDTKNCKSSTINFCVNYGSQQEILRAINLLLTKKKGIITINDLKSKLYTANLPDLDLVIRTSGEQRISNFMLFQSAYAEFYFPKVLWPDFNKKQLIKAIKVFNKRDRRFGGIKG